MALRVLVIDDDVWCLAIAEEYFSHKGFEVTSLISATCPMMDKGLDECPYEFPRYNILLTDNAMPQMTGLEFLEYIEERNCKIPSNNKQ